MMTYGAIDVAGVTIDFQRLIAIATAGSVVIFVYFFTHHTKAGLALRGIAQDEQAAMMVGIDSDLSATLCLAMGSALVAMAAVVVLPRGNLYPEVGWRALIDAVAVCIIGGLGSLSGTLIAGMLLGYAQTVTTDLLGANWQMVMLFLAILLVLIFKPSGLMGKQKELEERV
jgi:branched-chain amino acid transport system permease protein